MWLTAGKPVFVPARGDEFPHFTRSAPERPVTRGNYHHRQPETLKLPLGPRDRPVRLEKAQMAQWERQWGSRGTGGKNKTEQANSGLRRREKPINGRKASHPG